MAKKKKFSREVTSNRGVVDADAASEWLEARGLEDIECVVPDMAGVARGKIMPVEKFVNSKTMSIPGSIFLQTITGEYPDEGDGFVYDAADGDIVADAGFLDDHRRSLGFGSDRPDHSRCLPPGRPSRGTRSSPGLETRHRTL